MKVYLKNGNKIRVSRKKGAALIEKLFNASEEEKTGYVRDMKDGINVFLFVVSDIVAIK